MALELDLSDEGTPGYKARNSGSSIEVKDVIFNIGRKTILKMASYGTRAQDI